MRPSDRSPGSCPSKSSARTAIRIRFRCSKSTAPKTGRPAGKGLGRLCLRPDRGRLLGRQEQMPRRAGRHPALPPRRLAGHRPPLHGGHGRKRGLALRDRRRKALLERDGRRHGRRAVEVFQQIRPVNEKGFRIVGTLFHSAGRRQFENVSPSCPASIAIGFERSTSPARIRFERSLTT